MKNKTSKTQMLSENDLKQIKGGKESVKSLLNAVESNSVNAAWCLFGCKEGCRGGCHDSCNANQICASQL